MISCTNNETETITTQNNSFTEENNETIETKEMNVTDINGFERDVKLGSS